MQAVVQTLPRTTLNDRSADSTDHLVLAGTDRWAFPQTLLWYLTVCRRTGPKSQYDGLTRTSRDCACQSSNSTFLMCEMSPVDHKRQTQEVLEQPRPL